MRSSGQKSWLCRVLFPFAPQSASSVWLSLRLWTTIWSRSGPSHVFRAWLLSKTTCCFCICIAPYCHTQIHTWDDLHKSDSFENIPGMLTRQCMQWAGDCPVVTHCIRVKVMETPGPRGPGARSRYFGKDGEIRDIIKWRNAVAEISPAGSLTHPRKKFNCLGFSFSGSFHYMIYKPFLDIKFFLKT